QPDRYMATVRPAGGRLGRGAPAQGDDEEIVAVAPPLPVHGTAVGLEAVHLILDELDPVGLQNPGPRGADLLRVPLANGDPRERRPADERVRSVDEGDPGPGSQEPAGRAGGFQPSEAAAQDEKARRSHPSRY